MAKRERVTDPELLKELNAGRRQPVADEDILRELRGETLTDSAGFPIRMEKSKRAEPRFSLPAGARRGLTPSRLTPMREPLTQPLPQPGMFVPPGRRLEGEGLPGGGLPPGENVPAISDMAENTTEQQQRLAEFSRIARTPAGGPNLQAAAAQPIGLPPSDPYADRQQAGRAIWQLQNKGGTYDPNYQMTPGEKLGDVGRSIDVGFGQGVAGLGGLPGTIQRVTPGINEWLNKKVADYTPFGMTPEAIAAQRAADEKRYEEQYKLPDIDQMTAGMEQMKPGSMVYNPATSAGRYGQTAGSFLGAGGPGGRTAKAVALNLLLPAVATQAASDVAGNETAGLAAGLAAPLALKATLAGGSRVLSPFAHADPIRARHAATLAGEGIRLSGGDVTGNPTLRMAEEELGGGGFRRFRENQAEDLTQAATRSVSAVPPVRRADVAELNAMNNTISRNFIDLGARNVSIPDRRFARELGNAWRRYVSNTNPAAHNRVQQVEDYIVELSSAGRRVPASQYQSLRSRLARDARGTKDPVLRQAYNDIRQAVDDVMERSIARTNRADLGAFRQARRDWKNFITLEEAMSGASEATNLGLVTPAMLQAAVKSKGGRTAVSRGRGDLAALARASNALLRDLSNSRTAGRTAMRLLPSAVGGTVGTLAAPLLMGGGIDDPLTYARSGLLGLGGLLAPFAIGRGLLSRPGRAWMGGTGRAGRAATGLRAANQRLGGWTMPSLLAAGGAGVYQLDDDEQRR